MSTIFLSLVEVLKVTYLQVAIAVCYRIQNIKTF